MTHVQRLSRARIAGACLALTVISPASAPVLAQAAAPRATRQLEEIVPASVYSMMHFQHDPSMDFVNESSFKVLQAIKDARFHELAMDFFDIAVGGGDDTEQIKLLFDHLSELVGSVDWEALVESEMVYAEAPIRLLPEFAPGLGSLLFAFRPNPDRTDELEQSLANLLSAADSLTDTLQVERDERRTSDGPTTRLYSLRVSNSDMPPLVQMAVREDIIMLGCGSELFGQALSILEGDSRRSLVRTRRYKTAVGELSDDVPSMVYFDIHRLISWWGEEIPRIMEQTVPGSGGVIMLAAPIADLVELVDFMDVSVTASHARGHELISESWTTYRPTAVEQGNPLYLAVSDAKPSGELLDFVPANAISFDMTQSLELRPLYRWVLDRIEYYEPKAAEALVFFNAAQAAVDYSIEDDLLSWLGSESIVITLPSQNPATPTDTIIISRLRDREGARKTLRRFEAVFQELVPPLLEQWEEDMARDGSSSWIRKFEMTDAGGSFPFMKRLDIAISIPGSPIPIPSIPAVNFGVIGNFLMITTSEEALETVMAVAAGEEDGIWEHPAMLPEGRLAGPQAWSASLQPVGQQIQEAAGVCNTVAGIAGMMAMSIPSDGSTGYAQGQQMIALMTDGLRKVASIMQAMDFLDDSVTYTEMRDDGMTHYSRTSVRYLVDEGP